MNKENSKKEKKTTLLNFRLWKTSQSSTNPKLVIQSDVLRAKTHKQTILFFLTVL